jgi:hypothetical protein
MHLDLAAYRRPLPRRFVSPSAAPTAPSGPAFLASQYPVAVVALKRAKVLVLPGQNTTACIPIDTLLVHQEERCNARLKLWDEGNIVESDQMLLL